MTTTTPPTAPFPYQQCFIVLLALLPEVLIHHMLVPLYPFLAASLLPPDQLHHVGYYAGLLQSTYFTPTIVMNTVWGHFSDRIGRKPMLVAGLVGYGLGTLFLGVSTAYWTALLCLFVIGTFAGNTVIAKSLLGEIATDEKTLARAFTAYGFVFGGAGIFGSLAGGYLSNPDLFEGNTFLMSRPYFVVCTVGFGLAVLGTLMTVRWLDEPRKKDSVALLLSRETSEASDVGGNASRYTVLVDEDMRYGTGRDEPTLVEMEMDEVGRAKSSTLPTTDATNPRSYSLEEIGSESHDKLLADALTERDEEDEDRISIVEQPFGGKYQDQTTAGRSIAGSKFGWGTITKIYKSLQK
ncbi:hypothetical protein HK102_006670, partial [Quaeritorhiza haematococci]